MATASRLKTCSCFLASASVCHVDRDIINHFQPPPHNMQRTLAENTLAGRDTFTLLGLMIDLLASFIKIYRTICDTDVPCTLGLATSAST